MSLRFDVALLAVAAMMLMAAPAQAGEVSADADTAYYTAYVGDSDAVQVDYDADEPGGPYLVFSEATTTPDALSPCFEQFSSVYCPYRPNTDILLGDGEDSFEGTVTNDFVTGDEGKDRLWGFEGADVLSGGDGDDHLEGKEPSGPALQNNGPDDLHGGPGYDVLSYGGRTGNVTASLDGQPNDGVGGEQDLIASDVEEILGGGGDDTLIGDAAPNTLRGEDFIDTTGGGNDTIRGGDGNDSLDGGIHNDQLFGEGGADGVVGNLGDDLVDGGSGGDSLFGDRTSCGDFDCGNGSDRIQARDGEADTVACGQGSDVAIVDPFDGIATGLQTCENIDRGNVGPGSNGPGSNPGAGGSRQTIASVIRNGLKVKVRCGRRCGIRITALVNRATARRLRLARKPALVGKGLGSLARAGTKTVTVKLTAKAKRALRAASKVTLNLKIRITYSRPRAVKTSSRKVTLRR